MEAVSKQDILDKMCWAHLWHERMESATFKGNGATFWDNWAKSLPPKAEHSSYVEEVLSRLKLTPDDSLLDVGAGTGALAIPLARRVQWVTALDQSPYMLEIILRKASNEGLSNLATLNADWTQVQVGKDINPHDIVLVSRSLPAGKNIIATLEAICAAARRACYITWKANSYDELEADLCKVMGLEYHPLPDYIILYNLLYGMGIHANVDLFKTSEKRVFRSLDEAYIQIVRSDLSHDESAKRQAMAFLDARLRSKDGSYCERRNVSWVLISWRKDDE